MTELRGALMVCGATSDAGKSTIVTGLCRLLAREGVRVSPFKAQNMALNSVVTPSGHEIGRAQGIQAYAAGVEPEWAMNPILLKPTGEQASQVVVRGRPWKTMSAREYHDAKPALLPVVLDALDGLRRRYDVVICEGAGSPAEINLLDHDIVNLRVARDAGLPAIVVGDINPGGVFAALYGTVALLPDDLRRCVHGFVINKLRGDPSLLLDGCQQLQARTGLPVFGVVPWLPSTGLDAEDSMALDSMAVDSSGAAGAGPVAATALADELDVAVVRLPRISNFTDLDPFRVEPGVRLRFVHDRAGMGDPDLVILPGSKATVDDLEWLRRRGLADAITCTPAVVLGLCGGYQMLGRSIDDPIESGRTGVTGLGLLPVDTRFAAEKVTRLRAGTAMGLPVHGYQIHHGRVQVAGGDPFVVLDDGSVDGVRAGHCAGTTLHGLFEDDDVRRAFLAMVAATRGKRFVSAGRSFAAARAAAVDAVADALAEHLDVAALERLIAEAAPVAGGRA